MCQNETRALSRFWEKDNRCMNLPQEQRDKLSEDKWTERKLNIWLPDRVVPLNAGTCSPTLRPVFAYMTQLRQQMAADPQNFIWSSVLPLIEEGRCEVAGFLRCAREDLLLLQNVSFAANMVLFSLDFTPGDEVVMGDQEYHHFEALWRRLQKRRGFSITRVHLPLPDERAEMSAAEIVAAYAEKINSRTKVIFVSHVTFATGMILPVKEICALAREAGAVSIVDGAHAAGMIDVDLGGIGADFYCGTAHKWMMGAVGTGYLHVAHSRRKSIRPLVTSAAWEYDRAAMDATTYGGGTYWQKSIEYQGTQDRVPQAALSRSFAYTNDIGWENIRQRTRSLREYAREAIQATGLKLLSYGGDFATALTSFRIPQVDAFKAERWFHAEGGIELAFPILTGVGPVMRVSTAWFNSREDIDALARVLPKVPWDQLR